MTAFIITIIILTAALLWLLTRPLLNTRNSVSYERQAQNIHYAQERLAELEAQLKNATITASEYEALKVEIEQTLADDIDLNKSVSDTPAQDAKKSSKRLIVLLCTLLPICAAGIYTLTGTPNALKTGGLSQQIPQLTPENIDQVLEQVKQRLNKNPDDVSALNVMAQIHHGIGQHEQAIQLNKRLLELSGENPEVLSRLADVTALSDQGNLNGEAYTYLERALKAEPNHPQALWLAGLASLQKGDAETARNYWNTLLPQIAGTDQEKELKQVIEKTLRMTRQSDESDATNVTNNNQQNKATSGPTLSVKVSLSDTLKSQANPQDLVFVFAKAQQGPPAPLAVKRLSVADLPKTITLNSADAMMPQLSIAKFEQLVISARVAKSGDPIAQAGDLQSNTVKTSNTNTDVIEIVIDSIVE